MEIKKTEKKSLYCINVLYQSINQSINQSVKIYIAPLKDTYSDSEVYCMVYKHLFSPSHSINHTEATHPWAEDTFNSSPEFKYIQSPSNKVNISSSIISNHVN